MRRIPLVVCLLSIASLPLGASAQPRLAPGGGLRLDPNGSSSTVTSTTESSSATEPSSSTAESPSAEPAPAPAPGPVAEPTPYDEEEAPELRASEAQAEEEGALEAEAVPADADRLLEQAAPQENDPLRAQWTSPQRTFTLHGYMRMRTWLMDNYSLSRDHDATDPTRQGYPFPYFIPIERGATVVGNPCAATNTCYTGSKQYRYGDMRLRLTPTISLSDEIRVHAMVDLFDNMVLGSTPDTGSIYGSNTPSTYPSNIYPGIPVDSFSITQLTPATGRNSFQNAIAIRRAWAEIGNHSIGQLRFGRMGNHWGLGMLWNDGRGLDADYQTDVDRIMGITKWKGFTFGAAWDFANSGVVNYQTWHLGLPYDPSTKDNLHQFMLFAGHRLEPEEQRRRLEAGRWVLNGGVYFQYQSQTLSYVPSASNNANNTTCNSQFPTGTAASNPPVAGSQTTVDESCLRGANAGSAFFNRDTSFFTVDGWGQFLWREFRAELEVAMRFGGLNIETPAGASTHYGVRQIGYAFESEYHLLQHKLGIYFNQGYATGDPNVVGLSTREDHVTQTAAGNGDRTVTTFAFHPNYRIDLILFRTILGQVAGVSYFKPGISYDLIHTDYGRVLGARIDAIYSRANRAPQAYGDASSLGFEMDATLYYRTEDGPDLLDGVYLGANYGILIPLAGLGYAPGQLPSGTSDKTKPAMVFRVLMGVQF